MKRSLMNNFISMLLVITSLFIGNSNILAQGIFRNPIEPLPNMHQRGYYYIGDLPYHIDPWGNVTSAPCYGYNTYYGSTATEFIYLTRTKFPVLTPIAKVVAASGGTLIDKYDGFDDNVCGATHPTGNYVLIQHTNGLKTKYMQLHKGSVLSKPIGSSIAEGETLGNPGISSFGEGYFKFEVLDANNNFIDPFDTSSQCQGVYAVNYSLWKNAAEMHHLIQDDNFLRFEPRYLYSNIYDDCGNELNQIKHHFNYGDIMSLFVYWSGIKDSFLINVYGPTGFPVTSSFGAKTIVGQGSYHYRGFQVNLSGVMFIPGTYTAVCQEYSNYNSYQSPVDEIRTFFTVGCVADYTLTTTVNGQQGIIAGNNIYSTQVLNSGSKVDYIAGNEVVLSPGFKALLGSDVYIYNESCTGTPCLVKKDSYDTDDIKIYPNPSNDFITINTNIDSKTTFNIYNSTMQLVKTIHFENGIENLISTADLLPGIYFIDAQSGNQSYKTKFVVNR